MRYSRVASLFYDVPLVLLPSKAREIHDFFLSKFADVDIDFDKHVEPFTVRRVQDEGLEPDLDDMLEEEEVEVRRAGSTMVIPVYGVLSQRLNLVQAMSGGTSTQMIQAAFRDAIRDPDVSRVVFDIDSPGGSSAGIAELAREIRQARGKKPIVAVANSVAASGAYWLAASADYVYATDGALVGSIGAYLMHQDFSVLMANEGIRTTLVSAGKNKTRGNPYEPLSDDDKGQLQTLVDDTYEQFLRGVAAGRGTTRNIVRDTYGEGDVLTPKQALGVGMIDGIKTLDDVLASRQRPRALRQEREPEVVAARAETSTSSPPGATFSISSMTVAVDSGTEPIDSQTADTADEAPQETERADEPEQEVAPRNARLRMLQLKDRAAADDLAVVGG